MSASRPGRSPEQVRFVGYSHNARSFSGRSAARHAIAHVVAEHRSSGGQRDYEAGPPRWRLRARCGFWGVVDAAPGGTGAFYLDQPDCRRCVDLLAHDAGTTIAHLSVQTPV